MAFYVYSIPCSSYKATIKSMFDQHGISVKHFHLPLVVILFNFSVFPHSTASSVTAFMSGLVFYFYRLASSDHIVLFNCSPVFSVGGRSFAIFLALSVVLWKCVLGSWDFQQNVISLYLCHHIQHNERLPQFNIPRQMGHFLTRKYAVFPRNI